MERVIVATDTGGTFVDAVLWNESGRAWIGKAPSTPADPPVGIMAAVEAVARSAGLSPSELMAKVQMFYNGTTVTTNAMIERSGARCGLLTTAGFEDTLAIARVLGRTIGLDESQLYDYRHADPPPPIIPRERIRGIEERVDARGDALVPVNPEQVEQALAELMTEGIEVLAVSLLWSFRNPVHERAVVQIVQKRHPGLFVVASSDLVPIIREYERTNTTAINAYLGPVFERYAQSLRYRLASEGYHHEPLIMQSVGGLAHATEIERIPISTLFSGPVGGVIASQKLGRLTGEANLITTDMGGTSFDVGLILHGEPLTTPITVIERQMVAIPTVVIVTMGAGGGSVAWITPVGTLNVGPRSMGAMPGPACYNRGGIIPTVTDADVILGYIDPEYFLGGHMVISSERARSAMEAAIARPLGLSVVEAAAGVWEIVNCKMADLIRRATVERGHDPREFVMVAFGGCGPTHCTAYGPDIGVRKIIIPDAATVFSAVGIGQSDFRHSYVHSFPNELRSTDGSLRHEALSELNQILGQLVERALRRLRQDGVQPGLGRITISADLRYRNQIHDLTVPLPSRIPLGVEDLVATIRAFESQYDVRYGQGASSPTARIEWINVRVDVAAPTPVAVATERRSSARGGENVAYLGGKPVYRLKTRAFEPTPLYQAELLQPGHCLEGPALVVSYGTSIPLHDGQRLEVDAFGNFVVQLV